MVTLEGLQTIVAKYAMRSENVLSTAAKVLHHITYIKGIIQ